MVQPTRRRIFEPNSRRQSDKAERRYLHIDSSELRHESRQQNLFVVDRVTRFTYTTFFDAATKRNGAEFLRQAVQAFAYEIHAVLAPPAFKSQ